ncbi:thioredoxin-like protein, partial [Karstenula rhodostoma CBS 690.94]
MFAPSTSVFTRTLLTTARARTATNIVPVTAATLYRPLFTPKFFSNTATMSKEGVHNLTSKPDWEQALETQDTLLVLDCFATWCGPCKVIAPQVVKFSNTYPEARFYKIDVDEVPDVAQELGIRAMPTFLLFKNKKQVGEVVGANPKALEAAIKA